MKILTHLVASAVLAAGLAALLPGCQTTSPIPASATLVASGNGNTEYLAPSDGTLYIYDKTWNKMVYSGRVLAGDSIKVDALANKVFVDGRPVVEQVSLGSGSEYQFFLRSEPMTTVERRTITEERAHPPVIERRTVTERELSQ